VNRLGNLLLAVPAAVGFAQESGRMSDAQAAKLAEDLLKAEDTKALRQGAARLGNHVFKSSRAKEREIVLYAHGEILRRLGNLQDAAESYRKLERVFPRSPYLGEVQLPMGIDALDHKRLKEAEARFRAALEADIPGERKRESQELLLWILVETDRALEGKALLETLRPLQAGSDPSEKGLAAMCLVLAATDQLQPMEASRKDFHRLYAQSGLAPRIDLAYARLLSRKEQLQAAAAELRKIIGDYPKAPESDEAKLALATLLTDGKLSGKELKGLPDPEQLMSELRKKGRPSDLALAEVVEIRLSYRKELWEEVLDKAGPWIEKNADHHELKEVQRLWRDAWNLWVKSRVEKGYAGLLLQRLKPGSFTALEPEQRKAVGELLATQGLAHTLPRLLTEIDAKDRPAVAQAALVKLQPEGQPDAALALLPPAGKATPEGELIRLRAAVALHQWPLARQAASRAKPGPERIRALAVLLQRPFDKGEKVVQRKTEAEGWLNRLSEKGPDKESIQILVADLRLQSGDAKGALSLYPDKPDASRLGWVSLMRAQAQVRLGQKEAAKTTLKAAEGADGFRQQRETLAKSL
jgi:tetratricopeptide (TPR) repeat protein